MSVATVQLFDFKNTLSSLGTMDSIINITPPLKLSDHKKYYIRANSAELSTRIPNVFLRTDPYFNNTVVRAKRNVSDAWTTINLLPGNYTAQQIGQAIVSATSGWFINQSDPSLVISTNAVTDKVTITIVAGKLGAGGTQFCLDIQTGTSMNLTLGFMTGTGIFITNGNYASNLTPQLDTQTTTCDIICDLSNIRSLNGKVSKILFSIPLVLAGSSLTTFLYPPAGSSDIPLIPYSGPRIISNFTLLFRTGDDKPFYWLNGDARVQFSICEIV